MNSRFIHIVGLGSILLLYIFISVIPHYFFETNAYDLGIFNEALWNYSHLQIGPSTFRHVPTLFGDHFEIYLLFLSPLYYLFGSYTLLFVQIVVVFITAIGIYKVIEIQTKSSFFSWIGVYSFLLFFGTVIAVSFDFHNDVLGIAFIPWIFYFWKKRNLNIVFILSILMGFAKEPFFLISAMIGFSIVLFDKKKINKWKGFALFIVSMIIFVLLLKVIIPTFGTGEYAHWSYKELGDGPIEAVLFIIKHPIQTFSLFFSDPLKIQSLKYFLISGLPIALFFPRYLLIFLPFLAQKYFSNNPAHWGIYFHYNIALAPLIAITLPLFLYWISQKFTQYKTIFFGVGLVWVLGAMSITLRLHHIYLPEYPFKEDIFKIQSEKKDAILALVKKTQAEEIVAVQGNFGPHLVGKVKKLYIADKAMIEEWTPDLILLDLETKAIWPFDNRKSFFEEKKQIDESGLYQIIQKNNSTILYQKKKF